MPRTDLSRLAPLDAESGHVNAIIETPKGCRNKYEYDSELDLFKLAGLLTAGSVFPYDFGFIPSTLGGDGDPLDLLVLIDESTFTGCYLQVRLVGVIEAEQTERDGETTRNDRLIAVAATSHEYQKVDSMADLNENLVSEIEHFFVSYNAAKGKVFKPLGSHGPARAMELLNEAIRRCKASRPSRRKPATRGPKRFG